MTRKEVRIMVYHISYDLNKPGKDYKDLYAEIKKLGSWCHPVDSTWYVDTSKDASGIRDALSTVMDSSDELLVTAATVPGAWKGLPDDVSAWLKSHLS
jgi:hypothetical protein